MEGVGKRGEERGEVREDEGKDGCELFVGAVYVYELTHSDGLVCVNMSLAC